jgi:hypothetical protein
MAFSRAEAAPSERHRRPSLRSQGVVVDNAEFIPHPRNVVKRKIEPVAMFVLLGYAGLSHLGFVVPAQAGTK